MFQFITFTIFSIATVAATQINGVFTSFDSLVFQSGGNFQYSHPNNPSWVATLSWKIDGSSMFPGDTFVLTMPCVFKFTADEDKIDLRIREISYATCSFMTGDILLSYSSLECIISNSVQPHLLLSGTISFPFTFNVGGSALSNDLHCANTLVAGVNSVTFYDGPNKLSIQVTFDGGTDDNINQFVLLARVVPSLNKNQHFLVGGVCSKGYRKGTIGIEILDQVSAIDCKSFNIAITDALNAWGLAKNANTGFKYQTSCFARSFRVSYQDIPAGYRPFVTALIQRKAGYTTRIRYINKYTCVGEFFETDNSANKDIIPYKNSGVGANVELVEVITSTHTASTILLSTMPFTSSIHQTKTIVVNVPIPTVTTTGTYVGISTSYTTITASPGETATFIEFSPVHATTTITTCSPGQMKTITSVYSTSNRATDTKFIITECVSTQYVTNTWTTSKTITSTMPFASDKDKTMTIVVNVPIPTVTITDSYVGVSTSYTTITVGPGETATVIEFVPIPTVTITDSYVGVSTSYTTITAGPGETATVIEFVPVHTTTTVTTCSEGLTEEFTTLIVATDWATDTEVVVTECVSTEYMTNTWTGLENETSTLPFASGKDKTMTIVVNVPIPTVTITDSYVGVSTSYTTITVGPGETATVIEFVPIPTVTITDSYVGVSTSYTTITVGPGETATVIEFVPIPTVTITDSYVGVSTSYTTITVGPGETATVIEFVPIPTVTITDSYVGVSTSYTTITAGPGETATVIEFVPIPTVTITDSYVGVSTSYTTITAGPGETATVIEFVPVHTTTTVTTCSEGLTEEFTTLIVATDWATDTEVVVTECVSTEYMTNTWTGLENETSTLPFASGKDKTMTIVVNVPIPTVTITDSYVGVSTSYTTITAGPGETATVIEFVPVHTTTTVTTCSEGLTEEFTTLIVATDWATDTEVVVTECVSTEYMTNTWTGLEIETSTMPFASGKDKTMTIVVNVPIPTVTITDSYVGVSTSYTTITAGPGETATVIEFVPVHTTTTVTTCSEGLTEEFTTLIVATDWATDTEVVVTECESLMDGRTIAVKTTEIGEQEATDYVTLTSTWTGVTTETITLPLGKDKIVTVVINVPEETLEVDDSTETPKSIAFVTVISTWTSAETRTTTIPFDPFEDMTMTIVENVPVPTVTEFDGYIGISTSYTTISATPGKTCTVIEYAPIHTTTTITTCSPGQIEATTTLISVSDCATDTVIVVAECLSSVDGKSLAIKTTALEETTDYITLTSIGTGLETSTSTLPFNSPEDNKVTVVVIVPGTEAFEVSKTGKTNTDNEGEEIDSFITLTNTWTGVETVTSTIPFIPTKDGIVTIVVNVPGLSVTETVSGESTGDATTSKLTSDEDKSVTTSNVLRPSDSTIKTFITSTKVTSTSESDDWPTSLSNKPLVNGEVPLYGENIHTAGGNAYFGPGKGNIWDVDEPGNSIIPEVQFENGASRWRVTIYLLILINILI